MEEQQPPGQIEVGASLADGDLRYWRAKEAVRQGELRLSEQAAIRTALEARATAITGWASASLLAVTAASFTATNWIARGAGVTAALALFSAAVVGIYSARPRDWSMRGYDPTIIIEDTLGTELEVLESIAKGLNPGIQANNKRLDGMGAMLRWSGGLLIAAPAIGVIAYLIGLAIASRQAV